MKQKETPKLLIILGPTASGKTSLGIELSKKFDGEIISADSQQVYREMNIGTAKDDLTKSDIAYHLIDVVDPDESFDAARFVELADEAIEDITVRDKLPVIVGGTGFYIKAVLEGLCTVPGRDENIRRELAKSNLPLYDVLTDEDPVMAKRLHPNDHQRIIRAIEVKRVTGRSLSEFQSGQDDLKRYKYIKIGLNVDRPELYRKINQRVDNMIDRGLLKEVERLANKYGTDLQSFKAVGYKEIVSYLRGEVDCEEAIRLTKRNTRRFAKRQLTWFKADKEINWFQPDERERMFALINNFLRNL